VLDVMRDIPHLVRISENSTEFKMKVIELYGRSGFLCGAALKYMNNICLILLPPLLEMEDDDDNDVHEMADEMVVDMSEFVNAFADE
jgi:hypothetical protein